LAFGTRAPEGSDTVPENEAEEANVWAYSIGTPGLIARAAKIDATSRKKLRTLNIAHAPVLLAGTRHNPADLAQDRCGSSERVVSEE
jgi:hypothetical protein